MNSSQAQSLVRMLLNFISGAVLAWSASHTQAAKDLSGYLVQFINGPDVMALLTTGAMWLWGHITHSQSSPPSGSGGASGAGGVVGLLVFLLAASFTFTGCAPLQKGADPLIVRAEQSETVANATFDSAVRIDYAGGSLLAAKVPPFHAFCEWLRQPVVISPFTNAFPRGLAIVRSLDAVKNNYEQNKGTNEYAVLISSLAAVESATVQAQQLIVTATTK